MNLKDHGIQLEPNTQYRWLISIIQNPESHGEDIVPGGMNELWDVSDCVMTVGVILDCGIESVKSYARWGLRCT